jgi:hypothetical protein
MPCVRREALRRIPGAAGRNLEGCFWVNDLPGRESARGQQHACKAAAAKGVTGAALQDPRDMAKAGLLAAQSPAVKMTARRNDA